MHMLTGKEREAALERLDLIASFMERNGAEGTAAVVDQCRDAMYVYGPRVDPVVRPKLQEANDAFDRMVARREARRTAVARRAPVRRRADVDVDAEITEADADKLYSEMRRDKRMPDIGKGNKSASLRASRLRRLQARKGNA